MILPVIPRCLVLISSVLAASAFSGCTTNPAERHDLAHDIASRGHLAARQVAAGPYTLTKYERITAPGGPADVYIEGDGLAWLGRGMKSPDPTPTNPIALRLAAADGSANVVYLARPCQYTGMADPQKTCNDGDWTGARFSPAIIDAMNAALDQVKAQEKINGFHLIGYSGGGAIAALLTARRNDVLSLRTAAGVLDHEHFTALHHVTPMTASLNPRDAAAATAHVPQLHFIGADDKTVPRDIYESFNRAAGPSSCIHAETVPGTGHENGWAERWTALLRHPISCDGQ